MRPGISRDGNRGELSDAKRLVSLDFSPRGPKRSLIETRLCPRKKDRGLLIARFLDLTKNKYAKFQHVIVGILARILDLK